MLRYTGTPSDNGAVAQNPQVRPLSPSFIGRRVVWRGPAQRGFLLPEQRRAILDGTQRPPAPGEQLELRPDDVGEVIELVTVTSAGHQYAIRFANGYEIEVVLPSSIVAFLDDVPPPSPHRQPQYAPYRR
jgi:hypothetical protein